MEIQQTHLEPIKDWDVAYNNVDHIPAGNDYPERWLQSAQRYRDTIECETDISYGQSAREVFDLFLPHNTPIGLFVFVHGGYWVRFDKSYWSHFSKGFNAAGWAVAMPSYSLCPDVSIITIEHQIAAAITRASMKVEGPIVLGGHSAGGHLVSSMVCEDSPLEKAVQNRISHVLSISGVHDLRPLLNTALNKKLKLDNDSAALSSPALKRPLHRVKLTAMVGADERPEFIRQNALLANVWHGLGASVRCVNVVDRHHFNIVDQLLTDSVLISTLT